jgi:hypothetical protein
MWLGFFIPEKDGLVTESQALHRTFAARAGLMQGLGCCFQTVKFRDEFAEPQGCVNACLKTTS